MANGGVIAAINAQEVYVGVTAEGTFGFAFRAWRSDYGPVWLMPNTVITRPSRALTLGAVGDRPAELQFIDVDSTTNAGGIASVATATADPTMFDGQAAPAEFTGPAVLADGTVVWTPTNKTLMAVCADGRPRWAIEYYNAAGEAPRVFAAGDGTIVLADSVTRRGSVYRIDGDGNVLAMHPLNADHDFPIGYSDRCGVVYERHELDARGSGVPDQGLRFISGDDFSTVRDLPGGLSPANDCGGWGRGGRRLRADGTVAFVHTFTRFGSSGPSDPIELADGSWLFVVGAGAATPPGITIVGDDGSVAFDRDLDPAEVGERFAPGLFMLTPDGVLVAAVTDNFEATQLLIAIEICIGRAPAWIGTGGTWARDNATWHAGVR